MTAAHNVQHGHYYSERINTEAFQLILSNPSITLVRLDLGRSRQLSDLVQQRLVLTGRVLGDLVPEVINLLTRSSRRVALFELPGSATTSTHTQRALEGGGAGRRRGEGWAYLSRLDPANLHGQEELGHLDSKAPADAAQAGLGGQVHV